MRLHFRSKLDNQKLPFDRRFWPGAAFCDLSEVVTGCRASPVAAVVVGTVAVVVAVLFTGFENAQSQRRPEKPRVAPVHLRPRPVALPHLRRPLPVLGDGTQTHRACARRKHAAEHVRILQGRSLAAKENPMILPPRPIVEPEIADLSALNSTTMRSVEVLRACGRRPAHLRRGSDGLACAHPGDRVDVPFVGGARRSTNGGPFVMQSDRKSRLITICILASALVMIGLALTGTLQMRVSHSPKLVSSQIDRP